MAKDSSKEARDNRANQLNSAHPAYHQARGASRSEAEYLASHSQAALDNHADQLNPNSAAYRASRGERQPSSSGSSGPLNQTR